MKKKVSTVDYILVLVFVLVIFVTLYPFLNVLAISFNDATDTIKNINFIIPRMFTLSNYKYVFKDSDFVMPFVTSVSRTLVGTIVGVFTTSMLAYTLSRKDFVFHKPFTILFVITMYVGGGLIPEYLLIMRTLHLGNNFLVYIIPGMIWVYNMILVRSFIDGLPTALQEAAKIDGANDFQIWYKIVLPLCTPVIATIALYYAVGQWNSFMDTYLYAQKLPTLQFKMYEIMNQATMKLDVHGSSNVTTAVTPMSIRMAVTVVATLPIVIVYPFLQKYFIGGMTLGSVKD
ncbi:MAG: carbohydrate ABC transporter permease [Lachnospiraceae bacterium]|nr:carbohydrate ABC transporter permease [Lachnospiraceae bacterium]MCR4934646.1 carbohydrate ABC transporter permease [Lachnospiraceae bacterium]